MTTLNDVNEALSAVVEMKEFIGAENVLLASSEDDMQQHRVEFEGMKNQLEDYTFRFKDVKEYFQMFVETLALHGMSNTKETVTIAVLDTLIGQVAQQEQKNQEILTSIADLISKIDAAQTGMRNITINTNLLVQQIENVLS